MKAFKGPAICLHGSLRRSCEPCDLADRLEAAEAALRAQPHDHALCLAGFLAFVRGADIPETLEQARVALVERALRAEADLARLLAARPEP